MTKAPFMYPDKLPAFPANITPSSSSVYTLAQHWKIKIRENKIFRAALVGGMEGSGECIKHKKLGNYLLSFIP